jgi:predicted nucleic acid-binding Zn ribbon protein
MPTYQYKHKETGEVIEKFQKLSERDEWREQNPEWESHIGSAPGLVSASKSALSMAGDGWNDQLNRIKKGAGQSNTVNTK